MKNGFGYEKLGIAKVKYFVNIFIVYGVHGISQNVDLIMNECSDILY